MCKPYQKPLYHLCTCIHCYIHGFVCSWSVECTPKKTQVPNFSFFLNLLRFPDFQHPWLISRIRGPFPMWNVIAPELVLEDGIEAPIPGSNEPMKDEDWSGNVLLGNNLVVLGVLWFFQYFFYPPKYELYNLCLKNFCWTKSVGNSWVGENTGQFIIVNILGICVHQLYHISYVVVVKLTYYIYTHVFRHIRPAFFGNQ